MTILQVLLRMYECMYMCSCSFSSEWEGSLLAIFNESGDSWNPTPGNKLYEREAALCRRMEEGKAEYEGMVDQTSATQQDILGTQLPQVCLVCIIDL